MGQYRLKHLRKDHSVGQGLGAAWPKGYLSDFNYQFIAVLRIFNEPELILNQSIDFS